tara:strand:- start:43 stop:528 length:486 start_codon:yes stop_codon:yes gene_type:complete
MATQQTEDPIKCDKCNANTYRSHQENPDTWQYDYMAFCKDCQKKMNEDSDDEEKECASCNNILTWEDGEYSGEGHRCSGCYFKEEGKDRNCYDCGACDKCKEWNTSSELDSDDEDEEDEEEDAEYNVRCENGEAKCEECGKWGQALDMEYDDDTGFHICCE